MFSERARHRVSVYSSLELRILNSSISQSRRTDGFAHQFVGVCHKCQTSRFYDENSLALLGVLCGLSERKRNALLGERARGRIESSVIFQRSRQNGRAEALPLVGSHFYIRCDCYGRIFLMERLIAVISRLEKSSVKDTRCVPPS